MENKLAPIVIKDLHLIHVEVSEQKLDVKAFKEEKQHNLNVGHKLAHNLKDERIKLEFVFSFNNQADETMLFFKIDFHFHIANLANFYELNEGNTPQFSTHLVATLIGICFSTARGIIFEKLNNAGIKNILLPIVSPQEMLTQNRPKK